MRYISLRHGPPSKIWVHAYIHIFPTTPNSYLLILEIPLCLLHLDHILHLAQEDTIRDHTDGVAGISQSPCV